MTGNEVSPSRYPSAATAVSATMNYAEFFRTYREMGEGEINLSGLNLGMAACELAIAITPTALGTEPAPSIHSRLPGGELDPERIFDYLTEAERQNLQRASTIVELIRASLQMEINTHRRSEHNG